MRDIIRSAKTGRCALALIFGLTAACFGQEVAPGQAVEAKESATTPPAAAPETAKPSETAPPAAAEAKPATGKPASSKKTKAGKEDLSGGNPTFLGVEEKPYEIGPEDILFLNVLHQPDVTGTIMVRPDGFISVRFAGEIKAAGVTTQQLSDEVADKLTKYFNHPEVNIQVVRIQSKKYYIAGEVRKSGAYPLSTPKTVMEAIIEAGGLAEFAKKKKIYILRAKQRIPFNYDDVSKGKNLQQNILLQNGDIVQVP